MMDKAYRQYFDAMPCYLTVQDPDLRIINANKRFQKDFGDYEGRYCFEVYKHRSEKCEVCPVERVLRDGQCHRSEETVRCLDGREVSVLVEATPIRDENGEIVAVMEMSTDITQIKRMQTQLRRSQERYRFLFEEVPCYISVQNPDLRIIEANRAFREDFGNHVGSRCYEIYKHRTEECYPCPVQETFQDGKPHTREEVVTSNRGEHINVLVTTAPIRDAQGRILSVMEMSANITQVRQLESQLTSLGLMISSVSHGLKGLLTGLAGGIYFLNTGLKKDDSERIDRGLATVQRNVDRIRSMVTDILYYAKKRELNWETVSAKEIAGEACNLMESRAKEYDVKIEIEVKTKSVEFEADIQAIRSMLVNLVENSIDACRLDEKSEDRKVSLTVQDSPGHVEFEVADNGIGMDQETVEKAFTLFFSSKGTEGTGLGLYIANRIANSHGGSIELQSEPGIGTKFTVKLPRKRPPRKRVNNSHNRNGGL